MPNWKIAIPSTPSLNYVFVKNISLDSTEHSVKEFFLFCGQIKGFELKVDEEDEKHKTALIHFERESAAKTAVLLSNALIDDSHIVVTHVPASEQKENANGEHETQDHATSIQQTQSLNSLKKDSTANEIEKLKLSLASLEKILELKEDVIMALNRENKGTHELAETLKSLLQAKANETELLKQNMEHVLDKEKKKNRKLQKEIERLKKRQHQQTREESSSNNATFPKVAISNARIDGDDPNNDINYDTECGTEYSSSDDTSSEDGDNTNDFNYDSID